MTDKYAIIFDFPWTVDLDFPGMFFKDYLFNDLLHNDMKGTTKVHVVRLSDGLVTTLDTNLYTLVVHFSNSYQLDDDTIVVEGPAYENPNLYHPYNVFARENLKSVDDITKIERGAVYKKYIINLKEQTVEMENLIKTKYGAFEFPNYHPGYEAVAKHRYTYLVCYMCQETIDEDYNWPIIKYDDDKKEIMGTYGPSMTAS